MEDDIAMNEEVNNSITVENERLYREAVKEVVNNWKAEVMIDVGCGNGKYTTMLGKLMDASVVCGIDHEWKVLYKSRLDIKLIADLNRCLPIKSNTADVVIASQIIEHVAKTDVILKEIYRVLRYQGRVIIGTPNLASWHNVAALACGWQPFSMQVSDEVYVGNPVHPRYRQRIQAKQAHLRVFSHKSLTELMETHGFEEIETRGVGYYPIKGVAAKWMAKVDYRHSAYIITVARKKNKQAEIRYRWQ
jgi:ubiquinone/menaquinone biosynthesis C-methylase UbiE